MTWLWLSLAWFPLALATSVLIGAAIRLADCREMPQDTLEEWSRRQLASL